MNLITALLKELFGSDQAGGETMGVSVHMISSTHCGSVSRFSTAGADETRVLFKPPLPLEEALMHARKYNEKGQFNHT